MKWTKRIIAKDAMYSLREFRSQIDLSMPIIEQMPRTLSYAEVDQSLQERMDEVSEIFTERGWSPMGRRVEVTKEGGLDC